MSPTADKVKALIEAVASTSVAEVRSFLGMANYSANFIQHYSETTAPLRHLTKKNARFQWTKKCQKACETLKQIMVNPQVMSYYDPTRPTELIVYGLHLSLWSTRIHAGHHRQQATITALQQLPSRHAPKNTHAQAQSTGIYLQLKT